MGGKVVVGGQAIGKSNIVKSGGAAKVGGGGFAPPGKFMRDQNKSFVVELTRKEKKYLKLLGKEQNISFDTLFFRWFEKCNEENYFISFEHHMKDELASGIDFSRGTDKTVTQVYSEEKGVIGEIKKSFRAVYSGLQDLFS